MDLSVLSNLRDDYTDDVVIDPFEVDKRLSSIKIHKAPGPDGIPTGSFVILVHSFASHLQPFSTHLSEKGLSL